MKDQIANGRSCSLAGDAVINAKKIAQAALENDPICMEAFERAGYYLGMALANYAAIFNPTLIILGGGVSHSGELLFKPTRASLEAFIVDPRYLENLTLAHAMLSDEAALLGALAFARNQFPV